MLWLNESAVVPVERANALNIKLTVPGKVVNYACLGILIMGILLLALAVSFTIQLRRKKNSAELKTRTPPAGADKPAEYNLDDYKHLYAKE